MKKLIYAGVAMSLLLMASTMTVNAQPQRRGQQPTEQVEGAERPEKPTAEQFAEKKTAVMAEKLNLSEAQKKSLYKVNLDYAKKRIELEKIEAEETRDILELLDDDQKVEFIEMKMKSKGQRGGAKMDNKQQRGGQGQGQGMPQGAPRRAPRGPQPQPEAEAAE